MQQLPASDPRSWDYQPAIHRAYLTKRPSGAPWGTGQNATWFFLPWHRMYLFAFENIVRSLLPEAEAADWALPFWDYSSGAPANALPPAFRVPTLPDAMRNPLFVPARRASVNSGAALPSTVTDVATALAETHFTTTDLGASVGFGGPHGICPAPSGVRWDPGAAGRAGARCASLRCGLLANNDVERSAHPRSGWIPVARSVTSIFDGRRGDLLADW